MNRLDLDFTIEDAAARADFLNNYLEQEQFRKKPLTAKELDTCANYLFWGKDKNGVSLVQRDGLEVSTKNSTWNRKQKEESLEALLENPAFSEDQILRPYKAHYKTPKEVFSREKALKNSPEELRGKFEELFREIDELELLNNYYEIFVGKRDKDPRDELLARVAPERQKALKDKAQLLNQQQYLKNRHYLVELRRQQYTLKDTYSNRLYKSLLPYNRGAIIEDLVNLVYESDIMVYPLGLKFNDDFYRKIFMPFEDIVPRNFGENELRAVSNFYWQKQEPKPKLYIDFTEPEHVYNLILEYDDVKANLGNEPVDSTTAQLLDTLDFYIEMAELNEVQREILQLKIKKTKNLEIRDYINGKYDKTYSDNYISTIFKQKIIIKICEAAVFHKELISNIFFPENFKVCKGCGKELLICSDNFVKKSRSKDGFTNRCKKCDKLARKENKGA